MRSAFPASPAAGGKAAGNSVVGPAAAVLLAAGVGYLAASVAPGLAPVVTGGLVVVVGLLAVVGFARGRSAPSDGERDPAGELNAELYGDLSDPAPTVLWRLRASVRDTPGRLARLAGGLAELGGNIRTVHVHPTDTGAVDEILLHAPTNITASKLRRAVHAVGGADVTAVRADVRELDDVPTRAFTLATRLVDGSAEFSRVLRGVLGEVEVEWSDSDEDEGLTEDGMRLRAPGGGGLRLRRRQPEFTPAEFARARAMAELAATCRARVRDEGEPVRMAGVQLRVRRGDRDDLDGVALFHEKCSRAARSERYFMGVSETHQSRTLRRLLTPALGRTLLVCRPRSEGGEIVAMANLMYDGPDAEIGLLVRDDWQGRGIGSMLARRLVAEAGATGVGEIRAQTRVHNAAIARTLRSAGLRLTGVAEPGEWSWSRPADPASELCVQDFQCG